MFSLISSSANWACFYMHSLYFSFLTFSRFTNSSTNYFMLSKKGLLLILVLSTFKEHKLQAKPFPWRFFLNKFDWTHWLHMKCWRSQISMGKLWVWLNYWRQTKHSKNLLRYIRSLIEVANTLLWFMAVLVKVEEQFFMSNLKLVKLKCILCIKSWL